MPKCDESWTGKLRVVGDLERPNHYYLTEEDQCYFMGTYTARAGFSHSSTNQLISNLKKPLDKRGTPEWPHKVRAIREASAALGAELDPAALRASLVIPIPPSGVKGTPEYDDRMVQVARLLAPGANVSEAIITARQRPPRHLGTNRRDPAELRATLMLDPSLPRQAPENVILLDDVLTTGCSFRVCKAMLGDVWPVTRIFGLFIARVTWPKLDVCGFDQMQPPTL